MGRGASAPVRHRRHAQARAGAGQAGTPVGRRWPARGPLAEVVVILLDVEIPFEQQDLRIADLASARVAPSVVAINKWDLEDDKQDKLKALQEAFGRLLPATAWCALITARPGQAGASTGLQQAVLGGLAVWNKRIGTGAAEPLAGRHGGQSPAAGPAGGGSSCAT